MINDSTLNSFFILCFNKYNKVKKTKKLYNGLLNLVYKYKKINNNNIPTDFGNKFDLFERMLLSLKEGKTIEDSYYNINWCKEGETGKFDYKLNDWTKFIIHNKFSIDEQEATTKRIGDFNALISAMENSKLAQQVVNDFEANNYQTNTEAISKWSDLVHTLSSSLKKVENLNGNSVVEFGGYDNINIDDTNIEPILLNLDDRNDPSNKIPSGYDVIDNNILDHGFAKKSIYIFAGATKSGKSTLLINLMYNACVTDYNLRKDPDHRPKLFIYISVENDAEITTERIRCCAFNKTIVEVRDSNEDHEDIIKNFNKEMTKTGNMYSFGIQPANKFTVEDLDTYVDDRVEYYKDLSGKDLVVGAIYLDYITLLKSSTKGDLRHQLGSLTLELKEYAKLANIPLITAAQLNREGSIIRDSRDLAINMVGESHQLSTNTDSMFLMSRNVDDETLVHFSSGVQRSGRSFIPMDFKVDFEKYKFISCIKSPAKGSANIETGNMKIPKGSIIEGIEETKPVVKKIPIF